MVSFYAYFTRIRIFRTVSLYVKYRTIRFFTVESQDFSKMLAALSIGSFFHGKLFFAVSWSSFRHENARTGMVQIHEN